MSSLPTPGQVVTIEVLTPAIQTLLAEDDDDQGSPAESPIPPLNLTSSRVLGATEQSVTLATPMTEHPGGSFLPGNKLVLYYYDQSYLYLMLAKVIDNDLTSGALTLQPQGLMGHQRRRHPRIPVTLDVRYQTPTEAGMASKGWWPAKTQDLSSGGLLLRIATDLSPGAPILLAVDLPAGTIHAQGRVTRTRHDGDGDGDGATLAGVRFTEMTREDQALLDGFIAGLTPQEA